MTQPNPGDYVALEPKTSTPNASTPGAARGDDNGIAVHGTSVVQMQEQAWLRRAEAATAAAEELRKCRRVVAQVLRHNYFGDGCIEGTRVYDALQSALTEDSGWAGALVAQIQTMEHLATACTAAHAALSSADSTNASKVEAVPT